MPLRTGPRQRDHRFSQGPNCTPWNNHGCVENGPLQSWMTIFRKQTGGELHLHSYFKECMSACLPGHTICRSSWIYCPWAQKMGRILEFHTSIYQHLPTGLRNGGLLGPNWFQLVTCGRCWYRIPSNRWPNAPSPRPSARRSGTGAVLRLGQFLLLHLRLE